MTGILNLSSKSSERFRGLAKHFFFFLINHHWYDISLAKRRECRVSNRNSPWQWATMLGLLAKPNFCAATSFSMQPFHCWAPLPKSHHPVDLFSRVILLKVKSEWDSVKMWWIYSAKCLQWVKGSGGKFWCPPEHGRAPKNVTAQKIGEFCRKREQGCTGQGMWSWNLLEGKQNPT